MTTGLRIILLIMALVSAFWILVKIRKNNLKMDDAIYWVLMAVLLAFLGIFPTAAMTMARILGIQSPANFIYLMIFVLLFEKVLTMSILHSQLEDKYQTMAVELALRNEALEKMVMELQEQNEEKGKEERE